MYIKVHKNDTLLNRSLKDIYLNLYLKKKDKYKTKLTGAEIVSAMKNGFRQRGKP